ncbi:hypothetical protein AB0J74_20705 [Asanoa sp. NPDC049573]|uniref:hypothetical protein n=1 Tax=Asanoa sp. NPDC049573 TaxID=3155396 RepID=UPI00341F0806
MTLAIATYAAIVATCSLVVAFLAYRQAGPRVEADAVADYDANAVEVTVYNKGRGAITIVEVRAWIATFRTGRSWSMGEAGDEVPHRLEGHSRFRIRIPVKHQSGYELGPGRSEVPTEDLTLPMARGQFTGVADIVLGDGRRLHAVAPSLVVGSQSADPKPSTFIPPT